MKERENEVLATETGDRKRRQRQSTLTKQTNKKKKEEKFSYQSESDIHTVIIYTHDSHSINTKIA